MRSFNSDSSCKYFPSNFTPDLVLRVVNSYIAGLPYTSKDVVLFNYPSADMRPQGSNELFYPRAADEFYEIEKKLGCVKVFLNINGSKMSTEIKDPL